MSSGHPRIEDQPPPKKMDPLKPIIHLIVCEDLESVRGESILVGSSSDISSETVELVKEDFEDRLEIGTKRYGTPLQPHNGRNAKVDAYQEVADMLVYLRQDICERYGYEFNVIKVPLEDRKKIIQTDPVVEAYLVNLYLICKIRAKML
jgi:hypothetical protein